MIGAAALFVVLYRFDRPLSRRKEEDDQGNNLIQLHETEGVKPLIAKPSHRLWTVLVLLVLVVIHGSLRFGTSAGIFFFYCYGAEFRFRKSLGECCSCCLSARGRLIFIPFHTEGVDAFQLFGFAATEEGLSERRHLLKLANANLLLTYLLSVTPLFVLFVACVPSAYRRYCSS